MVQKISLTEGGIPPFFGLFILADNGANGGAAVKNLTAHAKRSIQTQVPASEEGLIS